MQLERYRGIVPDFERFADTLNTVEPVAFRARANALPPGELADRLQSAGFEVEPLAGIDRYFVVRSGPGSVGRTLEHWMGHLHVQQSVMALPPLALGLRPGERVLDLCAAPGGKTSHLSELMGDRGPLVAVDPQEKRIRGLLANLYRLGCSNVVVVAADGRRLPTAASFDRVLVDAPCTGEGNCRRGGGPRVSSGGKFRRYVSGVQEALLRRAVQLTRPGGTIVYSTCTFAPEENEAVLDRVLRDGLVVCEPIPLDLPHAPGLLEWDGRQYLDQVENAWRVYPHHLDSGGLFMARLRRVGGPEAGPPDPHETEGAAPGWAPVPAVFPGEDGDAGERQIESALHELDCGFGISRDRLSSVGWLVRGDHIWMQTAGFWPWPGWGDPVDPKSRAVSVGLRALRVGSSRSSVPTNDFLARWGSDVAQSRKLELGPSDLQTVLEGGRVPAEGRAFGAYVLSYRGEVVGRGIVGGEGLRSEIRRAHAERLLALLQ